jgi:hypothetical protein
MSTPDIEDRKLILEREKFDFAKVQAKQAVTRKTLGVIASAVAAILGVAFTVTGIVTTNITEGSRLTLDGMQHAADLDREYRLALLALLSENIQELSSSDQTVRDEALSILELSFPETYVREVLIRLPSLVRSNESIVEQVFEPLIVELDLTRDAAANWGDDGVLATMTMQDANVRARDILTTNSDLIPPILTVDALRLIAHYDAWLNDFERILLEAEEGVFVGPVGFPFPVIAEQHFRDEYEDYRSASED